MAVLNKQDIINAINLNLPDNNEREISPLKVRTVFNILLDYVIGGDIVVGAPVLLNYVIGAGSTTVTDVKLKGISISYVNIFFGGASGGTEYLITTEHNSVNGTLDLSGFGVQENDIVYVHAQKL